ERDDVATAYAPERPPEPNREHPVVRLPRAPRPRRTAKRRLHGRGGDLVQLGVADEEDDERHEDDDRERHKRPDHQWIEMRLGGQYVKNTSPIRSLRGTVPQTRESHDAARLSPIMKYRS